MALLAGVALGAGGTVGGYLLTRGEAATPSLYTNSNGGEVLHAPNRHIAAAVRYRGTVLGYRPIAGGSLVDMRVDGVLVAAHVYDPTWEPARMGQPLQVEGRIRGVLGDPIQSPGIPVKKPFEHGETLIDVEAAAGPHRTRSAARSAPKAAAGGGAESTAGAAKAAAGAKAPGPPTS